MTALLDIGISDDYSLTEGIVFSSVSLLMRIVGHLVVETCNIVAANILANATSI